LLATIVCTVVWLLVGKADRDRTLETLKYSLSNEADLRTQALSSAMFTHQQAAVLLARTEVVQAIVADGTLDTDHLEKLQYFKGLSGVTALHILLKDRVSSFPVMNSQVLSRTQENSHRLIERAFNGGMGRAFYRDSASRPIYTFATPIYLDSHKPEAVLLVKIDLSVTTERWQTSEHHLSMYGENGELWVDNDVESPEEAVSISRSFRPMGIKLVISSKSPSLFAPWIFRSVFLSLILLLLGVVVSSLIDRRKILAALASQKEGERKRLEYQANYDELTGLPNRRYVLNHLEKILESDETQAYVLLIDLDHFKSINDTHGHAAGDELLQQAASRIQKNAGSETVVARLGGDEFLMVSSDKNKLQNSEDFDASVNEIIERFEEPFVLGGKTCKLPVSPSIGITRTPKDGTEIEKILRNADTAMYMAKESGRNKACYFTPGMEFRNQELLLLESKLRVAISAGDQFKLYYQPQIDLRDNSIVGLEALIRWFHPDDGLILPDQFIPLAEETGLILPIGEWVLREAVLQISEWREKYQINLRVSVNVASRQLQQPEFYTDVATSLAGRKIIPDQFGIEITESCLIGDDKTTESNIAALTNVGISLSLDDFGTGYSAFSYLKKYPFDTVKIDRSFIQTITENNNDAALVQGIVNMSKNIGLKVVSEGVETVEQHNMLKQFGCDITQGYFYSKPLPADDFIDYYFSSIDEAHSKAA